MALDMNQYTIIFREDMPIDGGGRVIQAHRVEGWDEDYAFFGHHTKLDEVTHLIPRELVAEVKMDYDENGNAPRTGKPRPGQE